ncbi:MAG: hypothetical protein GXO28_00365 [Methanopyri archaeon]|nr:hypothetical protein [Methanopyri archaeon]
MGKKLDKLTHIAMDLIVHFILIVLLIITLLVFLVGVYGIIKIILFVPITGKFREAFGVIVDTVFDVILLLEAYRSVFECLKHERIPLRYVIDMTLMMMLRETFLKYYKGVIRPIEMVAVTVLVGVLIAARVFVLKYSPDYFDLKLDEMRKAVKGGSKG